MPYVISFISQKGGVGKSTLTRALAIALKKNDFKVKVADLDTQQGTVLEWHRRRIDNEINPSIDSVECYKTLNQAIENADDFDFLIVDAPARSSKGTLDISKISDIVIQPSGASLDDLNPAIIVFHELVKKGIDRKKLFMILCRVGTESEIQEAIDYITQAGYNLINGCLFEKASYRQSQNQGKTILENSFLPLRLKADKVIQDIIDKLTEIAGE